MRILSGKGQYCIVLYGVRFMEAFACPVVSAVCDGDDCNDDDHDDDGIMVVIMAVMLIVMML